MNSTSTPPTMHSAPMTSITMGDHEPLMNRHVMDFSSINLSGCNLKRYVQLFLQLERNKNSLESLNPNSSLILSLVDFQDL